MATSSKSKRNEKIDEKLLSTIKHYHSLYGLMVSYLPKQSYILDFF